MDEILVRNHKLVEIEGHSESGYCTFALYEKGESGAWPQHPRTLTLDLNEAGLVILRKWLVERAGRTSGGKIYRKLRAGLKKHDRLP